MGFEVGFCGFALVFGGCFGKRVSLVWYLVVREWCYAWLMWSLNSHIFGVEQCAKFCNFIWLAAL
jgi:hypothetical protein